ncbi:unnamed protein product [Urochloa decumbens]|uniref:Uncharacterized protein n=1 Tax=Urochloa decumbens TaxID=240449 RepID=A0ABC8VXJ6_9POAL
MIKSGLLSKVKIEILALEGDFPYYASDSWTAKEFDQHRANCRDGNGNVLVGEGKTVQLINGECDLGSIKFREGSSRSHKGMFIIGARVRDGERTGVRIQEAIMKPVVVQVSRNKENEKSYPPKPDHEVHRLEAIAKNGKYRKRLEKKSIITVQDFIRALNKDPDNLASILQIEKKRKAWEKMTRHASECHLEGMHKLKSYCCMEGNVVLFFDCLHYLVGATFDGCYTVSEKFSPAQQALVDELKKSAYNQIDALPENHVMSNNIPVVIHMDTICGSCASPSIMSRTTHQNSSSRLPGHQAVGIAAVKGLSNAQIEPSCAVANNDPGQSTHNYQDSRLSNQEQLPTGAHDNLCHPPLGHPNSFVEATEDLFGYEDSGYGHLLHPAYSINCAAGLDQMEIQRQLLWPGNDSFGALTSTGTNMTMTPRHLASANAPTSAQDSMASQIQAPFPNNGASETSTSAQPNIPSEQWPQCQGNMP